MTSGSATGTLPPPKERGQKPSPGMAPRPRKRRSSVFARGEPMVWLTGAALILCLAMISGLLLFVLSFGLKTFWPQPVLLVRTVDGAAYMGEVFAEEEFRPEEGAFGNVPEHLAAGARAQVAELDGLVRRRELRTGNYDLTNSHFTWISDFEVVEESVPEWAIVLERAEWGRFYGFPTRFLVDGQVVADTPEGTWKAFLENHPAVMQRRELRKDLENDELREVQDQLEDARLTLREVELDHGLDSPEWRAQEIAFRQAQEALDLEYERIKGQIDELQETNDRYAMVMTTADGTEKEVAVGDIVRGYPANQLDLGGELGVYASRWNEFITEVPRDQNQEGGVFPAIVGTVMMTMIMAILVVPFGVLAALYLREYAKPGPVVSTVRIAVNNLAGVPSIVFGVFGLGFFCYFLGVGIDELFFEARLPNPTYGTDGVLWASLTLALLTLPVVIVATEEALAAVPRSMREGSFAAGATKWQTIRRIVLPHAMPGVMTGMILAIARGAGEVAPLMLVGAKKWVEELPFAWDLPTMGTNRSFMHLGFHIYDLGFQSPNSEAAKPMVYTTTLLLIGIIVVLNVMAIWVRGRLRRRFRQGAVG